MYKKIKPTDSVQFELVIPSMDFNDEKKVSLRQEIANKYNLPLKNVEVIFKPLVIEGAESNVSLVSDIIENIQTPAFHLNLYKEYMAEKAVKDVKFEDIEAIDSEVNAYVDFNQYAKYKHYRFKYVKWSNYCSYGPDNYFDFTKLHGLVLLKSEPGNQGGKTTFAINLLRFALFGKAEKTPNLNDVFNSYLPEATEVVVEVCLEINSVDYVIRRTVTRPALNKRSAKSKPKQKVEYFKVLNDGMELIENCEEENTAQTNNIIKETVGSPDDFDLIISATKKTLDNIFEKGQTERGRLFSRWLGLLSLEKKEEVAKELWKKNIYPTLYSNKYNRQTLSDEIKDYETVNEGDTKAIAENEVKKKELEKKIEDQNTIKTQTLKNRRQIKEELAKIDIQTLETRITDINNKIELKRAQFKQKKEEYLAVEKAVFPKEAYDQAKAEIKERETEKHELEKKNVALKEKIQSAKAEVARIKKLIEEGTCPNCGQKVDVTMQNNLIGAQELEINRLIANGVTNKGRIDKESETIKALEGKVKEYEDLRDQENKKNALKPTLMALKENIDKMKLEIEICQKTKSDIEANRDNIKYNNEIDNRINVIDATITEYTKLKEGLTKDIADLEAEIKTNNGNIKDRQDIIKKIEQEDVTIRNWNLYQEMVGKNGVVKVVLRQALPVLNSEIARTLDGICDFDVKLEVNDKNEVEINLVRDGVKMAIEKAGSGLELTFAGLAVRNALAKICSFSRPSCLVTDEVASTVNTENHENLRKLYNRILENYSYIINIEHNADLEDMHDQTITITKVNNISHVNLT